MRKLLVALGAIAVGLGASACNSTPSTTATGSSTPAGSTGQGGTHTKASTTTLPPTRPTTGSRAATSAMDAALRHGGSRPSLHYVSTSVGSGLTTTIVGDVNHTSGVQTILVSYQGSSASMTIELVGHKAYFRGAAGAIEVLINLTARQSEAAAGQWVSVVPSDKAYYESTAAALTVSSVMSELALSPPIVSLHDIVSGGRPLAEIAGAWTGDGVTAKEHATGDLEVTRGDTSLPVRFLGVVPPSSKTPRFSDDLVVSKWGEAVSVTPPPFAVPLSTILNSTTTTTQPVVV